jgi:hypothetical protein
VVVIALAGLRVIQSWIRRKQIAVIAEKALPLGYEVHDGNIHLSRPLTTLPVPTTLVERSPLDATELASPWARRDMIGEESSRRPSLDQGQVYTEPPD